MRRVLGVDGARSAWVAVVLEAGAFTGCVVEETLEDLLRAHPDAAAFGIDVPIGLPTGATRPADAAARDFVGPRRSSVFDVPPDAVLRAPSYAEANALSKQRSGRGLSRQSYALRAKILEADRLADDPRVHEVHPEVSFRALKGAPLESTKRSWNGLNERIGLLAAAGVALPEELPCGRVAADDVVDAAAAAWSAERIRRGVAVALPADARPADARPSEGAPSGDARIGRIWY